MDETKFVRVREVELMVQLYLGLHPSRLKARVQTRSLSLGLYTYIHPYTGYYTVDVCHRLLYCRCVYGYIVDMYLCMY